MELNEIRAKAAEEQGKDFKYWIDRIKNQIKGFPKGSDIEIEPFFMERIINYCDSAGIPVYYVGQHCLSIAETYSYLAQRELER